MKMDTCPSSYVYRLNTGMVNWKIKDKNHFSLNIYAEAF